MSRGQQACMYASVSPSAVFGGTSGKASSSHRRNFASTGSRGTMTPTPAENVFETRQRQAIDVLGGDQHRHPTFYLLGDAALSLLN